MRSIILLSISAVLLSGCATVSAKRENLTPRQKVKTTLVEINDTHKHRATASCKQIDKAMAYAYLMFRTIDNKKIIRDTSNKTKGASLILKGVFSDLSVEYKRRCPAKPFQYLVVKKLYPDIQQEIKRRRMERNKQQ